jgi:hypothetical protein
VGVNPTTKKPARMLLLEEQVSGATDDTSLERELAITTLGDPKSSSPFQLLARLPLATQAELQALVGPSGVKLCHRLGTKKSCTRVTTKAIDANGAEAIRNRGGVIATYTPDDPVSAGVLFQPGCAPDEHQPNRIDCIADYGGPMGGEWVFEKTADGLRLLEIWDWAEEG